MTRLSKKSNYCRHYFSYPKNIFPVVGQMVRNKAKEELKQSSNIQKPQEISDGATSKDSNKLAQKDDKPLFCYTWCLSYFGRALLDLNLQSSIIIIWQH